MQQFLQIQQICFTYPGSVEPLFESVSFQLQRGWTGVVGANGSGKTTLLKLLTGRLVPDSGGTGTGCSAFYCEQRTDDVPQGLETFIDSPRKNARRLKKMLQIEDGWDRRWSTLSHGERKRCQIGVALFSRCDLLAVDEPSNHLDRAAKEVLFNALKEYRGFGLLVSHDRELLDGLCRHTLFLSPPEVEVRKCGYSIAVTERERERSHRVRQHDLVRSEVKKLKRQVVRHGEKASRAGAWTSKKGLAIRDHDAKAKVDLARLSGKDGVEGRIHRRLQSRLQRARERQDELTIRKPSPSGIVFRTGEGGRYFPLHVNFSVLPLGADRVLKIPDLSVAFGEKIALVGDNGSGKSTFLGRFVRDIELPPDRLIVIPQEVPFHSAEALIERIRDSDSDRLGQLMNLVSRLGSDPVRLLETRAPTPGEVRKLMLAEGLTRNPELIVLDEPTNHMDLPSIEHVESALRECPCSQLLVSHDRIFLRKVCSAVWSFEAQRRGAITIRVRSMDEIRNG